MKIFVFLFTFFFNCLISSTGHITGYALDAETQQPLIGTNITIENSVLGASCDENGYFFISDVPAGSYKVSAQRIGYATSYKVNVNVNANRQTPLKFNLVVKSIEGQEIVASSKYFEEAKDALISSQTINSSEIRSDPVGAYDIQMMIHSLPSVVTGTDQNNEIIVRGGGPSENLFVVDNLEIPNPNHFGEVGTGGGPVNIINTEFVEKIDFFAGGYPVKYGDKQSSVMDISFRDGNFNEIELDLEMSMAGIGFLIEGPVFNKNISFISSYRKSFIKDLIKSAGLVSVPEYSNMQHKITYNIDNKNKLMINFIGGADAIQIKDENRPDLRGAENVDYSGYQYTYGITLRSLISKNGYITSSLGKTLASWNAEVYKVNHSIADTFFYRQNYESDVFLKSDLVYKLSKHVKLNLGAGVKKGFYRMQEALDPDSVFLYSYPSLDPAIDLNQFSDLDDFQSSYPDFSLDDYITESLVYINPKFVNNQEGSLWKFSSYSQLKLNYNPLKITLGIRYDNVPFNNTSAFSPRGGLNYYINDITIINFAIGSFYQSPTYWKLLNPNNPKLLQHSRSNHIILGVDRFLASDTKLTFEYYYKKIKNRSILISDITSDPYDTILGFADTGNGESTGIELFVQKKYSDRWYGTLSYSYSNSTAEDYRENKSGNYPWDFDVRNSFTLVGGYKFNFNNYSWYSNYKNSFIFNILSFIPFAPSDQLEISFRSRYSDGLPFTSKKYNFYLRRWMDDSEAELNSGRRKYYYRFDIMIMRRFNFKNFNITTFIDIQNIFNRNNEWEKVYLGDGDHVMSYQYKQIPVAGLIIEL